MAMLTPGRSRRWVVGTSVLLILAAACTPWLRAELREIATSALPARAEPRTLIADVSLGGLGGAAIEYVLRIDVHERAEVYETGETVAFDANGLTTKWIEGADLGEALEAAMSLGMDESFDQARAALTAKSLGRWTKDWLFDRPILLKANARGSQLLLLSPEAPNRAAFFVEGR